MSKKKYTYQEFIGEFFNGKDYTKEHICPNCGYDFNEDDELSSFINNIPPSESKKLNGEAKDEQSQEG